MFLYVIGSDNIQKIGYSKDVETRLKKLQTGNPETLVIHHKIQVSENRVRILEKKIHREMAYLRVRGEWFRTTPENAIAQVSHAVIRWEDDILLE